ncbi:MAG: ribosome recycling factor [Patescibacteria group bacterium]
METDVIIEELTGRLDERREKLKQDISGIRTNRPSPEMIENIMVMYFDQKLPIKQLGSLSIKPPREIVVQVWDEQVISGVIKAIEDAKLGLSVQRDERTIRAFLPPLTDERRVELGKTVKKMSEETRIAIRTLRDDANKKIKIIEGQKTISEDQLFRAKEKIQKVTDDANKDIDAVLEKKIQELSV